MTGSTLRSYSNKENELFQVRQTATSSGHQLYWLLIGFQPFQTNYSSAHPCRSCHSLEDPIIMLLNAMLLVMGWYV